MSTQGWELERIHSHQSLAEGSSQGALIPWGIELAVLIYRAGPSSQRKVSGKRHRCWPATAGQCACKPSADSIYCTILLWSHQIGGPMVTP